MVPNNVAPIAPIELPDKRVATIGQVGGKQTVLVSANQGQSWAHASAILPYQDARGVAYSPEQKAFFIWHYTCDSGANPVPPDAIQRFDFDYTKD